MKTKTIKAHTKRRPLKPAPLRWDALPHEELRRTARESMNFGDYARAGEDAKLHVLKRRLPRLDAADHMNYVEITCVRMVQFLRAMRDVYRRYLTGQGARPLAEMQWVVCRCGVKEWAGTVLREAVFDYIGHCQIRSKDWGALFEFQPPEPLLGDIPSGPLWETQSKRVAPTVQADAALSKRIGQLVDPDVFDVEWTGGPFGRDGQKEFARSMFGLALMAGPVTLRETFDTRQALWDKCYPWTEGLAMLFDAAQEELFFQFDSLGDDAKRAESLLVALSPLQQIVHKHLWGMKAGEDYGDDVWKALLRELDENGILPDELTGKAKAVLTSVRKQGKAVRTFVECFESVSTASLDVDSNDVGRRRLKRELCHAIQGEEVKTKRQLEKIFSPPKNKGSVVSKVV